MNQLLTPFTQPLNVMARNIRTVLELYIVQRLITSGGTIPNFTFTVDTSSTNNANQNLGALSQTYQLPEKDANANSIRLENLKLPIQFIPEHYICPLSLNIMDIPKGILGTNRKLTSVDRNYIILWLEKNHKNPFNNQPCQVEDLVDQPMLAVRISKFLSHLENNQELKKLIQDIVEINITLQQTKDKNEWNNLTNQKDQAETNIKNIITEIENQLNLSHPLNAIIPYNPNKHAIISYQPNFFQQPFTSAHHSNNATQEKSSPNLHFSK